MPPIKEEVTLDTAQATLDRSKALTGSVSADHLANPPAQAPVTEPVEPSPVDRSSINRAAQGTQEFIQSESENAAALAERRAEFAALSDEPSLQGILEQGREDAGIPDSLKELKDINLQLADRGTESELLKAGIAGKAGQTTAAAGRAINQETREAAIRDAGLAARAQVLQGNIETASALVKEAVQMAYQDRTLKNNNLLAQINDLRGVVDNETQQLLDNKEREYQEDQASIQRVKDSVDIALSTGSGTAGQIQKLTDPNLDDVAKLKVAQEIIATSTAEDRNLKLAQIRTSISSAALSQKKSRLGLCQAGDSSYCSEFGIDPAALTEEEIEARINNQNTSIDLQNDMTRLQTATENTEGLQMSAGLVKSPFLSSALETKGGILTYAAKKEAKEQFLGNVDYLLKNQVFDKVAAVKDAGYSGSVSDIEFKAIGEASSVLNSLAIRDESGTLVGFRGGEENLSEELNEYRRIMQKVMDDVNIDALPTVDKRGIIEAYNE